MKTEQETPDDAPTEWFGNQRVSRDEKRHRVGRLFTEVADHYDLMNDLMSFGLHRLWKRFMVQQARLRPQHRVVEIAAGSGDLALLISKSVEPAPILLVTDINQAMLERARAKLLDAGYHPRFAVVDGQSLPLDDRSVDRLFVSFGLRNMVDQAGCLQEMRRVLADDGQALIMEFSMDLPAGLIPLYDAYSLNWLPKLGRLVAGHESGYRYLAESIRKQKSSQEMSHLLKQIGYSRVRINKLALGAVVLYRAWR